MNLSLVCSFFALYILSALANSEQELQDGFYAHRSADIIVDAPSPSIDIQLEWQLLRKQSNTNSQPESLLSVRDYHVHNLIARSLGLPQVRLPALLGLDTEMEDTVPFNFFSQMRGNMLFSVEGLTRENFPASARVLGKTPTYTLSESARPYHPLSTLATVVSGVQPRRHGVINERSAVSAVANIFDSAKTLYAKRDQSVVITGALSLPFAKALSAHKGSEAFYWNTETSSFVPVDTSVPASTVVAVTKDTIPGHLAQLGYPQPIVFEADTVKVGEVVFTQEDFTLFAEVAFVSAWSNHLGRSNANQRFLSYHFCSLVCLASKYGSSSPQWVAAVELIDFVLSQALTHKFTFEIIYFPTVDYTAVEAVVSPIVSNYVAENLFPQIFLTEEGRDKHEELCNQIREAVTASDLPQPITVFCPNPQTNKRQANDVYALTPLVSTSAQILAFHYVFWTMMVLLVVLVWGMYAMAAIPPDESIETAMNFKRGRA